MEKRTEYGEALRQFLSAYLMDDSSEGMATYLAQNSHLPGPRGNLELVSVFADIVESAASGAVSRVWELCLGMTQLSAEQAPVNSPQEFVPFCGTVGLGAIGARETTFYDEAIKELQRLSNDSRWRMREAVAMGLQKMLNAKARETMDRLKDWIPTGTPLELRAVAAGIAEPLIIKDTAVARMALELHERIIERVRQIEGRKTEDFRVLRQGLGYTLSVVISRVPMEGFDLIDRCLSEDDADLHWIAKSNLKKKRLSNHYPEQVQRRLRQI